MSEPRFPNESDQYRAARAALLEEELALRAQIERVAEQRRSLPPGGALPKDYVFQELVDGELVETTLSELFGSDQSTLFIYSFMYAPDMDEACPMCTSILDALDAQVTHIDEQISTAVVAKHDPETIEAHARSRGWSNLRLLSSRSNGYNADYWGEVDGNQTTTANVFVREGEEIRHFWNSEASYAPMIDGGHMRHLDQIWPLWGVLDLTPQGRGDWIPSLRY